MITAAIFRPQAYEESSKKLLEDLGFRVISRPLIEVRPTGMRPRTDADFIVFTSANGAKLALDGVGPEELSRAKICAIGPRTAQVLQAKEIEVDLIPEEYSSKGLVRAMAPLVSGKRVEVARSSAGSAVLLEGLNEAGAFVHETVIYTLECLKVEGSVIQGILEEADAFLFTSPLTAQNFLDRAPDQAEAVRILNEKFVGAIGRPTQARLEYRGVEVDLVPAEATFERLARELKEALASVEAATDHP
ncbi:MAG: uroporphyrinogen-III synthase [Candidatus Bipolaricaulia bacterium]